MIDLNFLLFVSGQLLSTRLHEASLFRGAARSWYRRKHFSQHQITWLFDGRKVVPSAFASLSHDDSGACMSMYCEYVNTYKI